MAFIFSAAFDLFYFELFFDINSQITIDINGKPSSYYLIFL